ncbi:hypothetical protein ACFX15_034340 [Malus domestica]
MKSYSPTSSPPLFFPLLSSSSGSLPHLLFCCCLSSSSLFSSSLPNPTAVLGFEAFSLLGFLPVAQSSKRYLSIIRSWILRSLSVVSFCLCSICFEGFNFNV